MRLGGTIEHQADSAAIEEAEPGRRLKEEAHSEDVPIKCDGPFHVFNRDRDLSYRAESKLGFRRLVHASLSLLFAHDTTFRILLRNSPSHKLPCHGVGRLRAALGPGA